MANIVVNRFIIDKKDRSRFNRFVKNSSRQVDFHKLIPKPYTIILSRATYLQPSNEYINIASACESYESFVREMNNRDQVNLKDMYFEHDYLKLPLASRQLYDLRLRSYNMAKYGCADWVEWNKKHIGTNVNAFDTYRDTFYTKWSAPMQWLQTLSQRLNFIFIYADEDFGNNCGVIESNNNGFFVHECYSTSVASTAFASYLWNVDFDKVIERATRENDTATIKLNTDLRDNFVFYIDTFLSRELHCGYIKDKIIKNMGEEYELGKNKNSI